MAEQVAQGHRLVGRLLEGPLRLEAAGLAEGWEALLLGTPALAQRLASMIITTITSRISGATCWGTGSPASKALPKLKLDSRRGLPKRDTHACIRGGNGQDLEGAIAERAHGWTGVRTSLQILHDGLSGPDRQR